MSPQPSLKISLNKELLGYVYGNIVLIVISLLAFCPVFFGFLVPFIQEGTQTGLLSAFLFISFIWALILKFLIQSYLFIKISWLVPNSEVLGSPKLTNAFEKLNKFYYLAILQTIILLSGLIPYLQVLTIWIAIPIGLLLMRNYAERQFFIDIDLHLKTRVNEKSSLPLFMLYSILISFSITILLLYLALQYGVESLHF